MSDRLYTEFELAEMEGNLKIGNGPVFPVPPKKNVEKKIDKEKSNFQVLNSINVSDKIEKKNGLSYLSWAYAWGELKTLYPSAKRTVYETPEGCIYHTDGKTCWVKVGITIDGIEEIEILSVLDYKNQAILLENVTSANVCNSIQRCGTKAIARHGLGLYIYAGEDLPESIIEQQKEDEAAKKYKLASDFLDSILKAILESKSLEEISLLLQKNALGIKSLEKYPDLDAKIKIALTGKK